MICLEPASLRKTMMITAIFQKNYLRHLKYLAEILTMLITKYDIVICNPKNLLFYSCNYDMKVKT